MTDSGPQEETAEDASSRRVRLEMRRRKRMRIIAVAVLSVVVLCAVAVAGLAYYDDNPPAKADDTPAVSPITRAGLPTFAPNTDQPRPLSHAAPLRLWVGGDSLAGSFGPPLGDSVGATGVVKTTIDYKVSSGLWGDDVRNWNRRATEQMASEDPEVVIFIIGTNDTSAVNGVDSNDDGIEDWSVGYRERVGRLMDTFIGTTERTVFWLGPPTLGNSRMDAAAVKLGALMKEEAEKRAPNVAYVDTYELFKSDDGEYSRTVVDENGEEITARIQDGVHFTDDGAEYLARALYTLLDAKFRITSQADITQPIGWSFADGTGENVRGRSSRPRPKYSSGGSQQTTPVTEPPATTPQTSPPATTAPPATSPPETNPPSDTTVPSGGGGGDASSDSPPQ